MRDVLLWISILCDVESSLLSLSNSQANRILFPHTAKRKELSKPRAQLLRVIHPQRRTNLMDLVALNTESRYLKFVVLMHWQSRDSDSGFSFHNAIYFFYFFLGLCWSELMNLKNKERKNNYCQQQKKQLLSSFSHKCCSIVIKQLKSHVNESLCCHG